MRRSSEERFVFWGFLGPTLFAFVMIVVIPFVLGVYYSFTDWTGVTGRSIAYVGLTNYRRILGDTRFFYSFGLTAFYALISLTVINLGALTLALLLTQDLKGRSIYRAGFFLPNLIGGLILGYIWQFALPTATFAGKPVFATELLAMNIYNTAFAQNDMAGGQAKAVVFFVVLVVLSLIQVHFNKKREVEL